MAHGNEINNKKYYWLKLDRHFFGNARIKKLRRLAGGDTYTIIYLKLMLLSIEFDGLLVFEGIEETFEKEMALKLEEDEENVSITINYLKYQGLLEEKGEDGFLPEAASSIGCESKSNVYKRTRNLVGKIPTKFQPNSNQIPIEIDKEIDKEIVKEESDKEEKRKRFIPPTLEEVKAYCAERSKGVDAEKWYNHYTSNGWRVGRNPMKDWKAAVRTWETNDIGNSQPKEDKPKKLKYGNFDVKEAFNNAIRRSYGDDIAETDLFDEEGN